MCFFKLPVCMNEQMGKTKRFAAFSDETRINWPLVRVPSHSLSGDE